VAFLGYPEAHKGWPVFRDLAISHEADARYEFIHLGMRPQRGLPISFQEVVVSPSSPDAMTNAIRQNCVDVALLWSLWPETFCFTAYEAIAGGGGLITNPDAGNVAALVRSSTDLGLVVPDEQRLHELFSAGQVQAAVDRFRARPVYQLQLGAMTADLVREEANARP
jgi:hypothetical protein